MRACHDCGEPLHSGETLVCASCMEWRAGEECDYDEFDEADEVLSIEREEDRQ